METVVHVALTIGRDMSNLTDRRRPSCLALLAEWCDRGEFRVVYGSDVVLQIGSIIHVLLAIRM